MTISDDLFRAILAMDAYNRGYGAGINFGPGSDANGTQIGGATISGNAETLLGATQVQAANFYAVSYTWNNHQIISYRGTDDPSIFNPSSDVWTGWVTGGGAYSTSQATLAAAFYKSVINNPTVSPFNTTTEFTGHSLGGGLAGLMAGLYGKKAVVFDNMPFELAAQNAYSNLLPGTQLYDTYWFNGATKAQPNYSQISGFYVEGEILQTARGGQTTPVSSIDLGPGIDLPGVDSGLLGGNLHSASLVVIGLYAQQNVAAADWKQASKFFAPQLFDNSIAVASGADAFRGAGNDGSEVYNVMRDAIAYSAIDVGTRVFGDTGIRALFDDACVRSSTKS